MLALIIGLYGFPSLGLPAWSDFLFMAALPWIALLSAKWLDAPNWDKRHRWSAAFGLLLPWILLSVVAEADNAARQDDTSGLTLVALVVSFLLFILRGVIQKRWNNQRE
jgi:hypothetical protein